MLLLSFIGHAYIWGQKPLVDVIPEVLARPWQVVAEVLKRPPVLSYASYALHNWYRLDPSKPIALGNISLLQNFLGGMDEEWFVLVHIDIEESAASAIRALKPAQIAAENSEASSLLKYLETIENSLKKIVQALDRMPERCDPYIYFHRVRPYIHGWKNNPSLPEGLLYESCFNQERQFFRGETGAQSSIVPALDSLFGIEHKEDELSQYLKEMRDYMPYEHRIFLDGLAKKPSIRPFIESTKETLANLAEAYNRCIDLIVRFRLTHLKYAALYIQKQSASSDTNPNTVGTGGTPFMGYLSKHEKESELYKIK
jgi:indoleamine 2,3-dioxygenase